jgi:hypothetical protein
VTKRTRYHLGIEIDKLTNSILNTISGDSFPTDVHFELTIDKKGIDKVTAKIVNSML